MPRGVVTSMRRSGSSGLLFVDGQAGAASAPAMRPKTIASVSPPPCSVRWPQTEPAAPAAYRPGRARRPRRRTRARASRRGPPEAVATPGVMAIAYSGGRAATSVWGARPNSSSRPAATAGGVGVAASPRGARRRARSRPRAQRRRRRGGSSRASTSARVVRRSTRNRWGSRRSRAAARPDACRLVEHDPPGHPRPVVAAREVGGQRAQPVVDLPPGLVGESPAVTVEVMKLGAWTSSVKPAGKSGCTKASQPKKALMCQSAPPACSVSRSVSPVLPGWPTGHEREREVGVAQFGVGLEAAAGEDDTAADGDLARLAVDVDHRDHPLRRRRRDRATGASSATGIPRSVTARSSIATTRCPAGRRRWHELPVADVPGAGEVRPGREHPAERGEVDGRGGAAE